ncbi:unnamed protein product [Paramecium pentaurelia]|uniref:Uncharacterized protein n=1 Tax=Paramecium pentaurelia TaxID=43138 RepID=A0A8S1WBJ3_9CILI|nr:unnamed protein product [Paramecium pentaurelia]
MRNRIIITSKIDDLISNLKKTDESQPPYFRKLSLNPGSSVESQIISHLKIRLDEDALQTKFVQDKTRSLANKIKQLQKQTKLKKVQMPQEYVSFINSIQENLIQQQETKINKILKRQQQYEEQNKSFYQFRIKALERQQQQIEQKHTELPKEFKSFYQPIEEASVSFNNMDQRIKQQLFNRGKRKFFSFWNNNANTPNNQGNTPNQINSGLEMVETQSQSFFQKQKRRISIQNAPTIKINNVG